MHSRIAWKALPPAAMLLALALALGLSSRTAAAPPQVARVWHGRTPNGKAAEYSKYLAESIRKFRTIPGNLGYEMMEERVGDETHFLVVSYWASRDAIHAYAGADIQKTRPLPRDAEFLVDPEPTVKNYQLVVRDLAP